MEPRYTQISCPNPQGFFAKNASFHAMHYMEWGDENAEKTVVCVHGLTRNARDFDVLACALAGQGYRVICPDIVGRGESEWLSDPRFYTYPTYVADVLFLLVQLGITRTHFVGTSMGGLIGMMVEMGMPQVIDKLVLNDIGAFIPKASLTRIGAYVGQEMEFETQDAAAQHLRAHMVTFGIDKDWQWEHVIRHAFVQKEDGKWHYRYDPALKNAFWSKRGKQRKMLNVDVWKMWKSLQCPTLIIRGAESDLLPEDVALKMAEADNVALQQFEGVGHAPMLMDDEQVKVICSFLGAA